MIPTFADQSEGVIFYYSRLRRDTAALRFEPGVLKKTLVDGISWKVLGGSGPEPESRIGNDFGCIRDAQNTLFDQCWLHFGSQKGTQSDPKAENEHKMAKVNSWIVFGPKKWRASQHAQ